MSAASSTLMRGLDAAHRAQDDAPPGELGWSRLSRAIDAETAGQPAPRFQWRPALRIAAAMVLGIGLWQLAVVPNLPGWSAGTDRAYVPATDAVVGTVTVAFAPQATEAAIRALLQEVGATITGGPSALGLWTLGFPDPARREAGIRRLRSESAIVETVQED